VRGGRKMHLASDVLLLAEDLVVNVKLLVQRSSQLVEHSLIGCEPIKAKCWRLKFHVVLKER
jgi:hypothetical protein